MGIKPYDNRFEIGEKVRIADPDELQRFRQDWKWHHPLSDEQLAYAGQLAKVEKVGFYHGGDPLYWLKGTPGIWHEDCLRKLADNASKTD